MTRRSLIHHCSGQVVAHLRSQMIETKLKNWSPNHSAVPWLPVAIIVCSIFPTQGRKMFPSLARWEGPRKKRTWRLPVAHNIITGKRPSGRKNRTVTQRQLPSCGQKKKHTQDDSGKGWTFCCEPMPVTSALFKFRFVHFRLPLDANGWVPVKMCYCCHVKRRSRL